MEEKELNNNPNEEINESKEELPIEETVNEEHAPETALAESNNESEIDKLLDNSKDVVLENSESKPYFEVIEEARQRMLKNYKRSRKISNIVMAISVGVIIAAFVFIVQKIAWMNILGFSLAGAVLVFMIVWYFVNRNKLPNQVKQYAIDVTNALNGHAFKNTEFSELKTDPADKVQLTDILSDNVYDNIANIASRNLVVGKFAGRSFKVGDVALRTGQGKNTSNVFFGKYFTYQNDLHFTGRYVIISKGSQEIDQPNAISDLEVLEQDEKFVIYGPKDSKYKENLGTKLIPQLKNIKVEGDLLNLVVCLWAGHSAAYLSYTDAIIALPFEKEFNKEPFENYISHQNQLLNALKTLLK